MRLVTLVGAIALVSSTAAFAAQPDRPGAFGRDRAAAAHSFQQGGAPGASEVGKIASQRGSTNGAINREYKATHGGAPTKGAPIK